MTNNTSKFTDTNEDVQDAKDRRLLGRIASLTNTTATANQIAPWYRPLVAIPASSLVSQYGRWKMEGVESAVTRAVSEAGFNVSYFSCRPIERQENPFYAVWQVVRHADAILIPGGITEAFPGWFMHSSATQVGTSAWWEDWWRWHTTQLAILLCVPFLGVDQGAGYLNVVQGGTLYQDMKVEAQFGQHIASGNLDANKWIFSALEVLSTESRIASCIPSGLHIWGACMHRQAVKALASDLRATALAMDKCIEVVERADAFFGMGVWNHPEQEDLYETQQYPRNLFALFCEAALLYATSNASKQSSQMEALRDDIWAYLRSCSSPHLLLAPEENDEQTTSEESDQQAGQSEDHPASSQSTDALHRA